MVGITNIIIRSGQDNCGTSTSQLMFELNSKKALMCRHYRDCKISLLEKNTHLGGESCSKFKTVTLDLGNNVRKKKK